MHRGLLLALVAVPVVVHLVTNGAYGYFRDELYYIACSRHLAAGYVDHPPLSILLLALERWLFGDSLHAIRLLPALASGGLVVLTALMVRELRGGRFALILAAVAVIIAPVYLVTGNFFSMNAFEPLFWMGCAYLVLRIINTGNDRLWVVFGVVAGLGIENKHSMLFFLFTLGVAILLTPQRVHLRSPRLWLGALVALFLFLPNLLWEVHYGWPTLEFLRNATAHKILALPPATFLTEQILLLHPLALPVWLAGLFYYLWSPAGRRYRVLGWSYLILLILFLVTRAKPYYLAPSYPMLLAAGAVCIERLSLRPAMRWLRGAAIGALAMGGVATAPMALPVLPVNTLIRYMHTLGFAGQAKEAVAERNEQAALPQYFADMFGWRHLVAAVARAYDSLPDAERSRCAIYTQNYGEAGAIDFFGKAYHLPHAISGHNNYWLWGPRGYSGKLVLVVGGSAAELRRYFGSVTQVATSHCSHCMPYENDLPIFLCRDLKEPLDSVWPRLKRYV